MQELSNVINKKYDEVVDKIKTFSDEFLNEAYKNVCSNAAKVLFTENEEHVKKGKSNSWAAGIVHAIGSVNNLFDSKENPYVKAADLYKAFEISGSTVTSKSKEIKTLLNISESNEKWIVNDVKKAADEVKEAAVHSDDEFKLVLDRKSVVAQKAINEAWKVSDFQTKYKIALNALSIYKDCSDAYVILATDPRITSEKKIKYLRRAVKAAENTLHITNLENTDERVFQTAAAEPLFGARYLLAREYWKSGNHEKAIRNALQIVKFDKRDRMVVRGLVSSWLLIDNRNDEAKIFLENLDKDFIASINYNRAAMFYRNGMKTEAEKALRYAFARNPYVYEYLTREKLLPQRLPKVKKIGTEEEAMDYARLGIKIWNKSEMIKWLTECKEHFEIYKMGESLQR